MAQSAAYNTTLKAGGTPTSLTNEACSKITANTVYRVTAASKRVLDPATAVVVQVDATGGGSWVTASSTTYSLDYFTGTITFTSDQGSAALVRISSGKYIPLLPVAYARSAGLNATIDELDVTDFQSAGDREFIPGLFKGDLSIEVVSDATDDLGAGDSLKSILAGRAEAFVEFQPGGQGTFLRFWALLTGADGSAPVDGLVTTGLKAVLTVKAPAAAFSSSAVVTS